MAVYPVEIPEALKERRLAALIRDIQDRPNDFTTLDVAATELGYAIMAEYAGTLAQESLVISHGRVVGIPRGTHQRLLRTLRMMIRESRAELADPTATP